MTRWLRISVDVDPDSDPIVGSVEAGGKRVDCYGWLELTAALDQAVRRDLAERRFAAANHDRTASAIGNDRR